MNKLLIILFGFVCSLNYCQTLNSVEIDSIVKSIDNDQSLIKSVYDWNELINQTTDGGGELIVFHKNDLIEKIILQGGLSYGRITSIIYLHNEQPIYLIEKEENFPIENDEVNYTKLEERFKEIIYVYGNDQNNPEEVLYESKTFGKRVASDNHCVIDELFEPISLAKKALKQK